MASAITTPNSRPCCEMQKKREMIVSYWHRALFNTKPIYISDIIPIIVAYSEDEICNLTYSMISILCKLQKLVVCQNTTHTMSKERFQKLIEWTDYDESRFSLLQQAWNNPIFHPFLSTPDATMKMQSEEVGTRQPFLVRLSNSCAGSMTVTRVVFNYGRSEKAVIHQRYFSSEEESGKIHIDLDHAEVAANVSWNEFVQYIGERQCVRCWKVLDKFVVQLGCGHRFHAGCMEREGQFVPLYDSLYMQVQCNVCGEQTRIQRIFEHTASI
mmetsp:Transcript_32949/g.52785  ORF Transcript_32949/g.52785 Transcript_32949/m.52785 type:complete len:270 (+) Transcript_32949:48-857(+)